MARAPNFDLGSMSLKELRSLLTKVDAAIIERTDADREAVREEIAARAREAGYTLQELFGVEQKKTRRDA